MFNRLFNPKTLDDFDWRVKYLHSKEAARVVAVETWNTMFENRFDSKGQAIKLLGLRKTKRDCALCEVFNHCKGCPLGDCSVGSLYWWWQRGERSAREVAEAINDN